MIKVVESDWIDVTDMVNWERILMNPVEWDEIIKAAIWYLEALGFKEVKYEDGRLWAYAPRRP